MLNLLFSESIFATCSCIVDTREALKEKNSEKTISSFSDTLHREYTYLGGTYAGPTVFDLSESEIKNTYNLMDKLSPSEYETYRNDYVSGIELLKTDKVKNSGTYSKPKALLIFKLDNKFQKRIEETVKFEKRVRYINQNNQGVAIVTIENRKSPEEEYIAYAGGNDPVKAKDVPTIVNELNKLSIMQSGEFKTVYLDLKNFPANKAEAFATTYRIQQNQKNSNVSIKILRRHGDSIEMQNMFFMRDADIKLISATEIAVIKKGKSKGYYQGSVEIAHKARNISVKIIGKTKEIVGDFVQRLKTFLSFQGKDVKISARDLSLGDYINRTRVELTKKHNLNKDDLIIQFKDQFGNIQIVVIKSNYISA